MSRDGVQGRLSRPARLCEMRSLSRDERRQSLCIGVFCLLIGISYGIAYGSEGGNQLVYLPPGIRLVDPDFLRGDWWASETTVYHIAFSYLIAFFEWLHLLPWAAPIGNIVLAAASYWCVYRLIQHFDQANALFVWIIFVFLFLGAAKSQSVAASYLFDAEFQASSIASFTTVLAIYFFILGRPLRSGMALAVGGLFHANFLILGIACFGLGHLLLGWRSLAWRSARQIGPSLFVLALQIPLILAVAGPELPSEIRAAAGKLVIEVAAPHHYQPRGFLFDFIPLAIWNALAIAMLTKLPGNSEKRRHFIAIYSSLLLVITIGTLLTTVVMIEFVSRLFVWRMAPFLLLCAHMVVAFALLRLLVDGFRAGPDLGSPPGRTVDRNITQRRRRLVFIVSVLVVGLVVLRIPNVTASTDGGWTFTRNFNLLSVPSADRSRMELYRWARTTELDSRFLVPPMLSGFRLHSRRAVYVDWKGRPFRPDELIEWHRRIKSITMLDRWNGLYELDAAYDALDDARIQSIAGANDIRYVVLHKAAVGGRSLGEAVFENDVYLVVRIRDSLACDAFGGLVARAF